MKRVIFTCFDDIDPENFSDIKTKQAIEEYFDRLVENKSNYAKSIGAEFIFYHNTMKDFEVEHCDVEFTKINLYKHHLMAQLAEQYDQVMYVDMDVVFNTELNVFEELDLSRGFALIDQDDKIESKDDDAIYKDWGLRNPTLKYHITKDLLNGKENHVINTGIMVANSEHIKQVKFVERLPDIVKRIQNFKENAIDGDKLKYIRNWYYPNNEAIFSYILEQYNIPYQIVDKVWHRIYDNVPEEGLEGNIIHFINKRFVAFFNDKTKVIFSIYIDIQDENLDQPGAYPGDEIDKSKRTQLELRKYKDQLIKNKFEYATAIGAEYLLYTNDDDYYRFKDRFPDLSEYDVINLYKIYLLDELTKQYDMVLYLDFDVYCRRKVDFFNFIPVDSHVGCYYNTTKDLKINESIEYFKTYQRDFRSPHAKYWNAHAMLDEQGYEPDNLVFNTGIVGATRAVMEQIDYFSDIDDTIQLMKDVKETSMYPDNIRDSFGFDNETIFSYKVKKNDVHTHYLNEKWHFKQMDAWIEGDNVTRRRVRESTMRKGFEAAMATADPILIHFISKQFWLVFDEV